MAKYKNTEHFNISGDKTVEVVLRFDVGKNCNDETILADAEDYLRYFRTTAEYGEQNHKAWGRSIEVRDA